MFAHEKLFDFVTHHIVAEGGDGDFTIECRLSDFDKLCEEFTAWKETSIIQEWEIDKQPNWLVCHDGQEALVILRKGYGEDFTWTFRVIL